MRIVSWAVVAGVLLLTGCSAKTCPSGQALSGDKCVVVPKCGDDTTLDNGVCILTMPKIACGAETHAVGNVCVPNSTTTCGLGTELDAGRCVPSAPGSFPTTWSANIRLCADTEWCAEPAIAADDSDSVVVAFMRRDSAGSSDVRVRLMRNADGGSEFSLVRDFFSTQGAGGFTGDVAMAASGSGDFYLAYSDYSARSQSVRYPPSDVKVSASHDHGATWAAPVVISAGARYTFNDRPWVAVSDAGTVHVHFTNGDSQGTDTRTRWARSTTSGVTFDPSVELPVPIGFYAAGAAFRQLALSTDDRPVIPEQIGAYDSQTFEAIANVGWVERTAAGQFTRTKVKDVTTPTRDFQIEASPVMAIAPTGRTCFVWLDAMSRKSFLTLSVAPALGAPATSVPVDDGRGASLALHAVVADADGRCHVMWLDDRTGAWQLLSTTLRIDGTLSPIERVTDAFFTEDDSAKLWLGDMNHMAVNSHRRFAAWTDTRGGASNIYVSSSPLEGVSGVR